MDRAALPLDKNRSLLSFLRVACPFVISPALCEHLNYSALPALLPHVQFLVDGLPEAQRTDMNDKFILCGRIIFSISRSHRVLYRKKKRSEIELRRMLF